MEKNGWKITAIVLIIFGILSLIGNILFIYVWIIGGRMILQENECNVSICSNDSIKADSYYYDSVSNTCLCYKDNKVIHTERMD